MPTRFRTGGVKVFFSVMSLSNKNMLFVHHCQWRIAKTRSIQSKYLCHSTTVPCHSSSSTQVPSGKDTAISFKAKVASHNFWSAAGLTMRVGGAWARIAQTATITKISTDYEEKVNNRRGLSFNTWSAGSLSSRYIVLPGGRGSSHSQSWRNTACRPDKMMHFVLHTCLFLWWND